MRFGDDLKALSGSAKNSRRDQYVRELKAAATDLREAVAEGVSDRDTQYMLAEAYLGWATLSISVKSPLASLQAAARIYDDQDAASRNWGWRQGPNGFLSLLQYEGYVAKRTTAELVDVKLNTEAEWPPETGGEPEDLGYALDVLSSEAAWHGFVDAVAAIGGQDFQPEDWSNISMVHGLGYVAGRGARVSASRRGRPADRV